MSNDSNYSNPFEHEAATSLTREMLLKMYIGDHNFSRFMLSKKNVFLLGERGSGKTMHLLYHSHPFQRDKSVIKKQEEGASDNDIIGIYVPNSTPLFFKREYEMFDSDLMKSVLSEHFIVTAIGHSISSSLSLLDENIETTLANDILSRYGYITGHEFMKGLPLFETLKLYFNKENTRAQTLLNQAIGSDFYHNALTFSSAIPPLLEILKAVPSLENSHFSFLMDDAHNLSPLQNKSLNSWIAFRDHSKFSFKVASKDRYSHDFRTNGGGTIIQGHDYTKIDLENFFYNSDADFGRLANDLISKRLTIFGIDASPSDFFPANKNLVKNLEECRSIAKKEAEEKYPNGPRKSINDYVYKYYRVVYFRRRNSKANRPPYSGFDILTNLSTGVIRNLLEPCYWMYDKQFSINKGHPVKNIEPKVQQDVILNLSDDLWRKTQTSLAETVTNCSSKGARQVSNLLDGLAKLFRHRLLNHKSEPRAIMFTISGLTEEYEKIIFPVFDVAREALLLYERMGASKDDGQREIYYIPNRMLWPARGLDPIGQFARASVKAIEVVKALDGANFSYVDDEEENLQQELFLD